MALPSKVLVANRGEIAIRIFRTLRELGVGSVAVYSEADRDALHPRAADEAYLIGPGPAAESYLVGERILDAARQSGAEAIHPGYGFLAENAAFARAVEESGLTWIGPPSSAIELMGSKTEARTAMQAAGVPIIPGATEPVETVAEVLRLGDEVGYPLIVKAAAGGGGKGMKLVASPDEAERAFESAQREGEKYFADGRVYVERYLEDPRHVEVQVLADAHGNVIHLGERDCTIQRRHQKLIEETPSPAVDARAARPDRPDRRRRRPRRRLPLRRHDRGAPDRGRLLLLHGDEHADPGRAHGHRGGDRDRPRPRAGADRGRRAALRPAGGRRAPRPRDRVPDQRRGRLQRLPARAGPDHRVSRAVRAGRARRLRRRRRGGDQRALRPDDREADRPRRRPRARPDADAARARRVRDRRPPDAARLPSCAALAPRVRRRRHRPRPRRVGGAGCAGRGADARAGRRSGRSERPPAPARDRGRGRRPPLRRHRARAGAALGGARTPPPRARGVGRAAAPAATPSSARCRGRC